jgi:RNA polymerase sigma-70 factor (ECF subfamily)
MAAVSDGVEAEVNLADLVRTHQADVWRYLRFLGADPGEAADLTQETFLAVIKKPIEIRSRGETAAYLRTAARRQLLKLRRRQQHEITTVSLDAAESVWVAATGSTGSLDEFLDALDGCIDRLEGRARQVIDLFYRVQAGRGEIAAQLDMKPDGVKTLLRRTRQLLRECIERRMRPELQKYEHRQQPNI